MEWLNYILESIVAGLPWAAAFSFGLTVGAASCLLVPPEILAQSGRRLFLNALSALSGLIGGAFLVWLLLPDFVAVVGYAVGCCVGYAMMIMFRRGVRLAPATVDDWLETTTERPAPTRREPIVLKTILLDRSLGGLKNILSKTIGGIDRIVQSTRADRTDDFLGDADKEVGPEEREADVAKAPRQLNANFFVGGTGTAVGKREPLQPGKRYDLHIDIGPPWTNQPSIVTGLATFPEQALPPGKDGHEIQVVFVSDDLLCSETMARDPSASGSEAHTVSAWLWLPRGSGRSHPIVDGKRQSSGPVVLRLLAPPIDGENPTVAVHGRLFLYFENNLLQSAAVRATVGELGAAVAEPNNVNVDFVLTESFQDVAGFATRDLAPVAHDEVRTDTSSVGLNVTLNEDGGGSHRIVIPSLGKPAHIHYDAEAMKKLLQQARVAIGSCFWDRDDDYEVVGYEAEDFAIEPDNGRTRHNFKGDLLQLARFGHSLYQATFAGVSGVDDATVLLWKKRLRESLAECTTIQITRTGGPPNFVVPWGLIYDYPLVNRKLNFCPIIREQWPEPKGRRKEKEIATACPHRHEGFHQQDILCPYGFWGMRHRIEQPPNLYDKNKVAGQTGAQDRKISVSGDLLLHAAFTEDPALDERRREAHALNLQKINKMHFAPPPATDWEGVQALMKEPQLVYFLCHGKFDELKDQPYLGVGPDDSDDKHRVYPDSLGAYFERSVDAAVWARNMPLIIINGCHTADLIPGQLLNFVTTFTGAGASGLIGTEVSIVLPVAAEAGEILLRRLANEESVTDAIRSMRWTLANRGNLLGLAYTPYCFADLRFKFGA